MQAYTRNSLRNKKRISPRKLSFLIICQGFTRTKLYYRNISSESDQSYYIPILQVLLFSYSGLFNISSSISKDASISV